MVIKEICIVNRNFVLNSILTAPSAWHFDIVCVVELYLEDHQPPLKSTPRLGHKASPGRVGHVITFLRFRSSSKSEIWAVLIYLVIRKLLNSWSLLNNNFIYPVSFALIHLQFHGTFQFLVICIPVLLLS